MSYVRGLLCYFAPHTDPRSFSNIILSRFFLNLRKASALATNNQDSLSDTSSAASGIGYFGGSIAFAGDGDREEDAELALENNNDDIVANEEVGHDEAQHDYGGGGSGQATGVTPASQAAAITSHT